MKFTTSYPASLRFILILSSRLRLIHTSGSFLQFSPMTLVCTFSSPSTCHMPCPYHPSRLYSSSSAADTTAFRGFWSSALVHTRLFCLLTRCVQFFTFNFFKSFSISLFHTFFGRPLDIIPMGFRSIIVSTLLLLFPFC
jgi:hypothetical protein